MARQMRQIVRDQLTQGASQAEILEFFAQRYGQDILASPPKSGFNLLAWIFPVVGMAGALIAGWLVIRSMATRRLVSQEPLVSQQSDLEPFLNLVDADIGLEPSNYTSEEGQPTVEAQREEPQREGGPYNRG
ncbi:MAG: cytochrome c-type biogenesis protein CcmH [Dehalococcoidia bacterium]